MSDLFKNLKPTAHPSKSGFDLSRKHVFSSAAGQLNPCLFVETVPGDHFEIDLAALTRSQRMITAAFVRGSQRFDFFFVPYSQLWHPFNQFVSQRIDKHSSLQKGHVYTPVVSLGALIKFIYDCLRHDGGYIIKDVHGYEAGYGAIKLLDLAGYGDYRWLFDDVLTVEEKLEIIAKYNDKYVNVFRLLAFNHIWYDYYRNKYYDVDDNQNMAVYEGPLGDYVDSFNLDDIDCSSFANSIVSCNYSNLKDRYRWGRMLAQHYIQWKKVNK